MNFYGSKEDFKTKQNKKSDQKRETLQVLDRNDWDSC